MRAVSEVAERTRPDVALANHLVMGPVILARALGAETPYAVKVHGSALEYTVRPNRERFLPYALEGVRGAQGVLVGSRHTAESLWEVLDEPGLPERTRLGPPGVDVHTFRPRPPEEAAAGLRRLAERLESGAAAEWGGEADAAAALASLDPSRDRIVSYVGKLIVSKGVDLLLAAWPLVVARVPDARLVIVGFGTYRETLGRYVDALRARRPGRPARHRGARARAGGRAARAPWRTSSPSWAGWTTSGSAPRPLAAERVHFTGRLEHEDLPDLLPACEAQVMPSTFPEAFGMVAAEAAACGALPLSADHSGMAEVTATLAPALSPELRPLLSFEVGPGSVEEIAGKLVAWLSLDAADARAGAGRAGGGGRRALRVGERGGGRDRGGPGQARRSYRLRPRQRIVFPTREPAPEHGQAASSPRSSRRVVVLSLAACGARRDRPLERQGAVRAEVRQLPHPAAGRAPQGQTGPSLDAAFRAALQDGR